MSSNDLYEQSILMLDELLACLLHPKVMMILMITSFSVL